MHTQVKIDKFVTHEVLFNIFTNQAQIQHQWNIIDMLYFLSDFHVFASSIISSSPVYVRNFSVCVKTSNLTIKIYQLCEALHALGKCVNFLHTKDEDSQLPMLWLRYNINLWLSRVMRHCWSNQVCTLFFQDYIVITCF